MKNILLLFLSSIFIFCSCAPVADISPIKTPIANHQISSQPLSQEDYQSRPGASGKILIVGSDGFYRANADGSNVTLIEKRTSSVAMQALSPQGDRFAYFKDNVVYIKDLTTGNTVQLTHELIGTVGGKLEWSPDGAKIAFACSTGQFPDGPVCLLDAQSGAVEKLLGVEQFAEQNNSYFIELQDWSQDGSKILFNYSMPPEKGQKGDFELYLYDTTSKEITLILDGKAQTDILYFVSAAISPDNQTILIEGVVSSPASQVFSLRADGSSLRQLTSDKAFSVGSPIWSPDGHSISVVKCQIDSPSSETVELLSPDGEFLSTMPISGAVIGWVK